MTQQATNNREAIADIRRRMLSGVISYEQAQIEAKPVIDAINAKAAELAKKHKVRASKVNFAGLMR